MADLSCQELVELVTDYLDGALPGPERARFEAHLAVCPGCATYLDQIRETASLLGGITVDSLTEDRQSRLLTAFRDYRDDRA